MIELENVYFRWHRDKPYLLNIPSFKVESQERIFLEGPSGSGKTTLLSILGAVTVPESGSVKIDGIDLTKLTASERDAFRADRIGIIFQLFNLIPYLSALENVLLPCRFSSHRHDEASKRSEKIEQEATRLLKQMKLDEYVDLNSPAFQLSIGQQQRVAAARSLIGSPKLIIADEPTSALDYNIRDIFLNILFEEINLSGATLLFISHDSSLSNQFDRRIKMNDINKIL